MSSRHLLLQTCATRFSGLRCGQAPANRKSWAIDAAGVNIVVHVPDRGSAGGRIVKENACMAWLRSCLSRLCLLLSISAKYEPKFLEKSPGTFERDFPQVGARGNFDLRGATCGFSLGMKRIWNGPFYGLSDTTTRKSLGSWHAGGVGQFVRGRSLASNAEISVAWENGP